MMEAPTGHFSVIQTSGAGFLPKQPDLSFAEHTFKTVEREPSQTMTIITAIEYVERYLKGASFQDINKQNRYFGIVASPGFGKSHLLDWITKKCDESGRLVLRLAFNARWKKIPLESEWSMEQRIVGRVICLDYGCIEWEVFARWYMQSPLFSTTFTDLLSQMDQSKTVVLLVDEVMLYNDKETTQQDFVTLSSFLYSISDKSLVDSHRLTFIPFITSLHYSYVSQVTSSTQRPIQLFTVDRLEMINVKGVFAAFYDVYSEGTVDILVSMCQGHARSIEYVYLCLSRGQVGNNLTTLLTKIHEELATTTIFSSLNCMMQLLPIFLDTLVHSSLPHTGSALIPSHSSVPINGSEMVFKGVYINQFGDTRVSDTFYPKMTLWHIYSFCNTDHPSTDAGELENWKQSLHALIASFAATTKESFESFVSRALHVRLECLRCLENHHNAIPGEYHRSPLVSVCGPAQKKLDKKRPLFAVDSFNHIFVPADSTIRKWRVVPSANIVHLKVSTFPTDFFSSGHQYLGVYHDPDYAGIIRPTNVVNAAVDSGVRLWCNTDTDTSVVFGVTIFVQNIIGQLQLFQPKKVREYIQQMQVKADEYLQNLSALREQVVLCIFGFSGDGDCLTQGFRFNEPAEYSGVTYPAVRYPVILVGNSCTALLGDSFRTFFSELFRWKEATSRLV